MFNALGVWFATIYVEHIMIMKLLAECVKKGGEPCSTLRRVCEEHRRKELELGLPTVEFEGDVSSFCSKFVSHVEEVDEILRARVRELLEEVKRVCAGGSKVDDSV